MCSMRWLVVVGLVVACNPQTHLALDGGGDPDAATDASLPDAPPPDGPPGSCEWACETPIETGCVYAAPDVCGNGLDDNCNGSIDESCPCQSGAVQSCFPGFPARRSTGACVEGSQVCQGSGATSAWGLCEGVLGPTAETCDSQDNDCNGCVDDDPACCAVELRCPGPGSLPDGTPFHPYIIDGTAFYAGTVLHWSWSVAGGPCDRMLSSQSQVAGFSLSGSNTSQLTIHPTLSGELTVNVTMTLPDGTTLRCTFLVHIAGPGLRVELCWDTTPNTDLDLHLHRPGTTTPWFQNPVGTTNPDDCHYINCKQDSFPDVADWGYAKTPQPDCPPGWPAAGCDNPRLDLDNLNLPGVPENINVDVPEDNGTYRILVHYYTGMMPMTTHPMVNIYCDGHLEATYGAAPDVVTGFDVPGYGPNLGPMWRVADVTTAAGDCTVEPLHPPSQTTGYWVTYDDPSY